MNFLIIAAFALGLPAVLAYGVPSAPYSPGSGDLQSLFNLAAYNGKGSSYDQVGAGNSAYVDQHHNNQYQAISGIPDVANYENSVANSESLALQKYMNDIRSGNVKLVAPNEIEQISSSSVKVPKNPETVVTYTKKQPTVFVEIPGSEPVVVDTGKPALIKAGAMIIKMKPESLQTTEIRKHIPNPINYSPLYVKVLKQEPEVNTKYSAPSYGSNSYGGDSYGSNSYGSNSYGSGSGY